MSKKKLSSTSLPQKYAYIGLVALLPILLVGFGVQAAKVWLRNSETSQVLGVETEDHQAGTGSTYQQHTTPRQPEPGWISPTPSTTDFGTGSGRSNIRPSNSEHETKGGSTPTWPGARPPVQLRIYEDGQTASRAGEMPPRYPHDPIKVGTPSARHYEIENGGITAQTRLSVSIDSLTHQLDLTTPTGTASISVLPDDALRHLYEDRALSSASAGSPISAITPIILTEMNNQPVYEVQGTVRKKLFGLVPLTFSKTVYVSANNGQTLQTVESAISKFFERFSF